MSAGKGDKPRPVDKKKYNNNFEKIVWAKIKPTDFVKKKGKLTYVYK
jgi:hypothetical protein